MKKVQVKKRRISYNRVVGHLCGRGKLYFERIWKKKYGNLKTAYVSADEVLKYLNSYRRYVYRRRQNNCSYYTDLVTLSYGISKPISGKVEDAYYSDSYISDKKLRKVFKEEFNRRAK